MLSMQTSNTLPDRFRIFVSGIRKNKEVHTDAQNISA